MTTDAAPSLKPVALLRAGIVTAIGGDAGSTFAAMRARFNNHKETDYTDQDWNPIVASRAAVDAELFGEGRLIEMAVRAIRQIFPPSETSLLAGIPWAFCSPEESRPGRTTEDQLLLEKIARQMGVHALHADSAVIPAGRTSGLVAMAAAQTLFSQGLHRQVLILATDSLVDADALAEFEDEGVLLTPENHSGFIPAEAAVALLVGSPESSVDDAASLEVGHVRRTMVFGLFATFSGIHSSHRAATGGVRAQRLGDKVALSRRTVDPP